MRLMVTGGAGFVGSNFIRYMLDRYPDYTIVNYDQLTCVDKLIHLSDLFSHDRHKFVQGDICDSALVCETIKWFGIDAVINFAAETNAASTAEDTELLARTNVFGTQVLLDACRMQQVKRFVQISTGEVYGSLDGPGYFTEASKLAPTNLYASSKAEADLLVLAAGDITHGLHVNVARSACCYGPFHYQEHSFIPRLITSAIYNESLPDTRDGRHAHDWLHVMDHASAIDLVLHDGKAGEVYNIGSYNERRQSDVAELILGLLEKPAVRLPNKTSVEATQQIHQTQQTYRINTMDPSKLAALGWRPKYTFELGIVETVAWFEHNHAQWQQLMEVRSKELKV
ncbi:dTDP-glucose 4,6-dehydratase [Paenibacillus taihuensis]|uniref:dTDP-glucose 4,6-dehydratase n=1 Tax=Paenibacillus taihuensis TaxID=1156355 RepID=A0A3D9SD28_9BACL|nr:GDP-mannose 4,6-dehydratase [Paenibacillus taihuensis]REE92788.1 dTDP-glucose 4,6-dehydratase [Paenibacillus taihuensis]